MVHMIKFKKNLKIFKFYEMAWGGHCATSRKVAGSITNHHLIRDVYTASNINEYHKCFLCGKMAGA